ncbi:MAG: hypothetical protein QNJ54_24380 [Prochloraceae cyanobacterium]|nr:hypothetical protein [Prochloraceae cyanobacterium]
MIISGGAAKFLQPEIEQHCNSYRPVEFVEKADKYNYQSAFYIRLGDDEESIELICDRLLAQRVTAEYNISGEEIEKMALDNRLVDNYGSMKGLLDKERKYQALQRSIKASKAGKASKEARENKAASSQTADSSSGDKLVDSNDGSDSSIDDTPNEEDNSETEN